MTPEPDARQLNAFIDGELDLAGQLAMESRLAQDAGLRAQVESLHSLRRAVTGHADYHVAPAALRGRIQALGASSQLAAPRHSGGKAALQRWFAWRPLLSSLGAVALLAIVFNLTLLQPGRDGRLEQEVIASHVRATLTQHLVDVASSDHHTVKPWLSSRLDFSPPVPELGIPGSTFLGGRVDYLDGRPVAALVYRQGEHVVNSFVWPGAGADSGISVSTQRGFQIAHWTRDGMKHWVISDVNRDEFMAIVRELALSDVRR